jgi:hypothetical protein
MTGSPKPKQSKWGRRAAAMAVFLALGFVVNMSVAWAMQAMFERGWLTPELLKPVQITREMIQSGEFQKRQSVPIRRIDALIDDQRVIVTWVPSIRWYKAATVESTAPGKDAWSKPTIEPEASLTSFDGSLPTWFGLRDAEIRRDTLPWGDIAPSTWHQQKFGTTPAANRVRRNITAVGLPFVSNRLVTRDVHFHDEVSTMSTWARDTPNRNTLIVTFWPPSASIGGEGYPLRPIWPGAILNTVFYGVIVFSLWCAWIALKRHRRRKRNLCVRCAYSLAGITTSACPECGAAILPTSPLEGRGREAQPSG